MRRRAVAAMRWTAEQDDVLRESAHLGAAGAARELLSRCGARHTVRAVEMRASRIRCSLERLSECPSCGVVGAALNRQTGMCPLCTERYHLERERAFHERLLAEIADAEGGEEVAAARRERDRLRQRNSRLCRKHGLAGRRERERAAKGRGRGDGCGGGDGGGGGCGCGVGGGCGGG